MKPIRPWVFGLAYLVAAAVLVAIPSTTIEGDRPPLRARAVAMAQPLAQQVPATTPIVIPARRTSDSAILDDPVASSPTRIRLPGLDIDGPITPVGLGPDRQLDVPAPNQAGWYQHSSAPLSQGATVIAAHVDFGGHRGLFFELGASGIGDEILIDLTDGTTQRYVVTEVTLHDKRALPAAELFRSAGPHVLYLVTCGGSFDPSSRSYLGNQVVTAVPA